MLHHSRLTRSSLLGVCLPLVFGALAVPAQAQSVEQFYKNNTITIIVGLAPGGGFDNNARMLARHIGRHIPGNPNIIVQNLPGGAGHLKAAQYVNAAAPKDGTVISAFTPGLATLAVLQPGGGGSDLKDVTWLGSVGPDITTCYVWHTTGAKSWDDVRKLKLKFGAAGKSSYSWQAAEIIKNMFKLDATNVVGYPGSAVEIAIEGGELNAKCGSWLSMPVEFKAAGKTYTFVRFTKLYPDDMPKGVPTIYELASSDLDRKAVEFIFSVLDISRPFAVSKDVPADRLKALRAAFDATMKDPAFLEDAKKLRLPVQPIDGPGTAAIVKSASDAPPDIIQRAKELLGSKS